MKREKSVTYFDENGKEINKKEFLAIQKKLIVGDGNLLGKPIKDGLITRSELNKIIKEKGMKIVKYKGKKYIK
jgi:ribosomal protein L21